jgi:hypothetical protein
LIFFKPEVVTEITDEQGRIVWDGVEPGHYRSTTFYQYKSVLKHAGVLVPHSAVKKLDIDYFEEEGGCSLGGNGPGDLQVSVLPSRRGLRQRLPDGPDGEPFRKGKDRERDGPVCPR